MRPDDEAGAGSPETSLPRGLGPATAVRRGLVAFGRFWWDFLVGETPELLVGSGLAVGVAALLVHTLGIRDVVVGAFPVLVVTVLALSSVRARSRAEKSHRR